LTTPFRGSLSAQVQLPALTPALLVGGESLLDDGSKDEGALARLQHSLSTSFVAKGDARDLSRLLERYADWASGLGVRERWPSQLMTALDKVPKVKIKAWLRDQRAAQIRRHGKRPEDEVEAADAKAQDAAVAHAPALDEAALEKIRANKERALAIRRAKEEADAVARDLAAWAAPDLAAWAAPVAAADADTAPTQHVAELTAPTQLVVVADDASSQPVLLENAA